MSYGTFKLLIYQEKLGKNLCLVLNWYDFLIYYITTGQLIFRLPLKVKCPVSSSVVCQVGSFSEKSIFLCSVLKKWRKWRLYPIYFHGTAVLAFFWYNLVFEDFNGACVFIWFIIVLGVTSHTWKCMFVIHVLLSYLNILQFVSLSLVFTCWIWPIEIIPKFVIADLSHIAMPKSRSIFLVCCRKKLA